MLYQNYIQTIMIAYVVIVVFAANISTGFAFHIRNNNQQTVSSTVHSKIKRHIIPVFPFEKTV